VTFAGIPIESQFLQTKENIKIEFLWQDYRRRKGDTASTTTRHSALWVEAEQEGEERGNGGGGHYCEISVVLRNG